jgi:hypothetical protein
MAWEARSRGRGRYYTRSRKIAGRVVREYIGTGEVAEVAAAADALRRADRRAAAEARRAEDARWREALTPLLALCRAADLMARAALLAAGYHRHSRSSWRRKRHVHHDGNAPEAGQCRPGP